MTVTINFSDRFSYPAASGVSPTLSESQGAALSQAQLESQSPELANYATLVRSFSVVLGRATTYQIFRICITNSDPRIALVLAAARKKVDNQPLLINLSEVKQVMFGDRGIGLPVGTFLNRDLFSDGIIRVSAALTAALLIGTISQVVEQAEHAKHIEKEALADLDRIIMTYELSKASINDNNPPVNDEGAQVSLFFTPGDFDYVDDRELFVEWFNPTISATWMPVNIYTGPVSTWTVVSDISDAINATTVNNEQIPLLSVANLSGLNNLHTISFYPRRPLAGIVAYSINVRIRTRSTSLTPPVTTLPYTVGSSPFLWGPFAQQMHNYPLNGAMVILRNNQLTSIKEVTYKPSVIYFRKRAGSTTPITTTQLKFRVQPFQPTFVEAVGEPQEIEVDIPYLTLGSVDTQYSNDTTQATIDLERYAQVALGLTNGLASITGDTRVVGGIIRNDDSTNVSPMSAVELVSWSASRTVTAALLDVISMPPDIESAVGDLLGPYTSFSAHTKSIKVEVVLTSNLVAPGGYSTVNESHVLKRKASKAWRNIQDEANRVVW